MSVELISIIDLANQCGKKKQTFFKIARRLGIEPSKRHSSDGHGQEVAFVTTSEAILIKAELRTAASEPHLDHEAPFSSTALLEERGVFYSHLLEPDHDSGRFKVGFTINMPERLRTLRC